MSLRQHKVLRQTFSVFCINWIEITVAISQSKINEVSDRERKKGGQEWGREKWDTNCIETIKCDCCLIESGLDYICNRSMERNRLIRISRASLLMWHCDWCVQCFYLHILQFYLSLGTEAAFPCFIYKFVACCGRGDNDYYPSHVSCDVAACTKCELERAKVNEKENERK